MTDQKQKEDLNTPFKSPTYQPASPSTNPRRKSSNRKTSTHTRVPSRGSLHLTRTASHREVYDAETRSVDGEFGGHSRSRHEDYPHLHHDDRRISAVSTTNQSKDGLGNYEKRDRIERAEDQEILEDIQSGHSGESVVEMYEGDRTGAHSDGEQSTNNSSNDTDLEKGKPESKEGEEEEEEHHDDDLVTWDTPESMENPRNWTLHRRWAVIGIVSSYTFLSPLSSSMIAPALPVISRQFNITSSVEQSLMLSVFVLAYAIGPMLLGPLSEMFGRRLVLQISNLFFIVFTVACAVAQDRIQLSIFRFFAGLGGSAPLSIGGGTVSDLMAPDERGTAMSVSDLRRGTKCVLTSYTDFIHTFLPFPPFQVYSLGPLLGPAVGPIIGGWVVQRTGNWRWIFGIASIAAGVTATIGVMILPETYAPRILAIKARRLRKETGNPKLHTIFDRKGTTFITRLEHNMIRPFIMITTQPIIIILSLYMMIMYGTMYLVLTTFESVFRTVYNESVGIASLNYISLAIGFTVGGQIGGRMIDRFYKKLRDKNGGKGIPEFKLPVMMATCWCLPAGLIVYGWSAQYAVHWIVPNIGSVLLAIGMLTNFQCIQNYTVDSFGLIAASALAALVFLRSLAGFALPLGSGSLYGRLGYGWGNTVLAFVSAAVGIPAPFLLFKYGPALRKASKYAKEG